VKKIIKEKDFYKVLGVDTDATKSQIKKAYRKVLYLNSSYNHD